MHGRFRLGLVIPGILFTAVAVAQAPPTGPARPDAVQRERLARVRVPFVENCGQWDERVAFAAKTNFGTVFVTHKGQLVYSLPSKISESWTLTETAISGKPAPRSGPAAVTRVSYFHGNDPDRWQSGSPSYEEISLGEVWRGVSVSLRAHGGNVEKLFTIQPGARPEKIRLRVGGASSLRIDPDGTLVAGTGNGEVRFSAPEAYQERGAKRHPVKAAYVLRGSRYGFHLGSYDHTLPVAIDPLLQATYLGGSGVDGIAALAIHPASAEVFVGGATDSADFPGTAGGAQSTLNGPVDAFVARLDPTLTTLLQATYLGGSGNDVIISMHPASGEVFVAGFTDSSDFPATAGGAQPSYGGSGGGLFFGGDGFVARLDPTLTTLLQATYLGGSEDEEIDRLAIHPLSGDVFVVGATASTNLPGTAGGAQPVNGGGNFVGGLDGFVARLDATLTTFLQATYLGGSSSDSAHALAIDPSTGQVFVAGSTSSTNFPGTAGGAQPAYGGGFLNDGFVARLNPALTTLLQATYLGGAGGDWALAIAVHPTNGEVLVAGDTGSANFPGVAGGAQPTSGGDYDGFVARLDSTLTALLQATYIGGGGFEEAEGIAVQPSNGEVLVAGYTDSADFPGTAGGAQPAYGGGDHDVFVAHLGSTLTTLVQATYLGGSADDFPYAIAVDPSRAEVLVAGVTDSSDFPGTAGGAQPAYAGGDNEGFVTRLTPDLASGGPCVADSTNLCLNGGRFRVRVTWSVPSQGRSGIGQAVPLTGDTGYFWFFNSDNIELVIKALDARGVNGHYWVFYGALSSVQYTITVTDTVTGAVKTYENPAGTLASVADTSAFSPTGSMLDTPDATSTDEIETRSAEELYGLYAALTEAVAPKVAAVVCTPGGTTLCLNQSRFQLTVDWEVPSQGRSGHGTAVPITADTGDFWFFSSDNVELVVKVLDARGVNGHFWVFYGALSNVQYTITVKDTATGAVRSYENPSGTLASVADTSAF